MRTAEQQNQDRILAASTQQSILGPSEISKLLEQQGVLNRNGKPFGPCAISGWSHNSLPIPAHVRTPLKEILANHPTIGQNRLVDVHEINRPYAARIRSCGLSSAQIVELLKEHSIFNRYGKPYNIGSVAAWCSGRLLIPEHAKAALDEIIADHKAKILARAEDASQYPCIHATLKELREKLHMTQLELAEALLPYLPAGKKPSKATISFWETAPHGTRKSALPSRNIFAGTDAITAYGEVFHSRGMGEWFDARAEGFRQSLLHAMTTERKSDNQHSTRWNTSRFPEDKPSFWDDYVAKRKEAAAQSMADRTR